MAKKSTAQHRTVAEYRKLLEKADTLLFPVNLGEINFFGEVPKAKILEMLEDWEPDQIGQIDCGWDKNDPNSKRLVHYDGWIR